MRIQLRAGSIEKKLIGSHWYKWNWLATICNNNSLRSVMRFFGGFRFPSTNKHAQAARNQTGNFVLLFLALPCFSICLAVIFVESVVLSICNQFKTKLWLLAKPSTSVRSIFAFGLTIIIVDKWMRIFSQMPQLLIHPRNSSRAWKRKFFHPSTLLFYILSAFMFGSQEARC